jgi:hypothetical protein
VFSSKIPYSTLKTKSKNSIKRERVIECRSFVECRASEN